MSDLSRAWAEGGESGHDLGGVGRLSPIVVGRNSTSHDGSGDHCGTHFLWGLVD